MQVLMASILLFVFAVSNALACDSANGPVNRSGEAWIVTYAQDLNGKQSFDVLLNRFDALLEDWPCSEILVSKSGYAVLTVGTVPTDQSAQYLARFKRRENTPIPNSSFALGADQMEARFLNGQQLVQLQKMVAPGSLAGSALLFVSRNLPGLWQLQLDANGVARFRALNGGVGSEERGAWSIQQSQFLCIDIGGDVCFTLEKNGAGVAMRDATNGIVQSEFILQSLDGPFDNARALDRIPTRIDAHVAVFGRTLRDKEIWRADLYSNGRFDFITSSGKLRDGRYSLRGGQVCFVYTGSDGENCRFIEERADGQRLWRNPQGQPLISEIVGLVRFEPRGAATVESATRAPAPETREATPYVATVPRPVVPRQSRPATGAACRNVPDFCLEFVAKSTACGFAAQAGTDSLAEDGDSGMLTSAATSAGCAAVMAELEGLPISAADLGLAAFSGAATSAGFEKSFWDGLAVGATMGGVSFLSCQATVSRACRAR